MSSWNEFEGPVWTEPGPRKMSAKFRERFIPQKYVRKWIEGNEEMIQRALKRFKRLKLRIDFCLLESRADTWNRKGLSIDPVLEKQKKFTKLRGKSIVIRGIPTPGMVFKIIKAVCDAAEGATKE